MLRSELFRLATEKNALRRSSGLPLLDVRAEMEREAFRAELARYNEGFALFRSEYTKIKQQVLAELRIENGPEFGRGWVANRKIADRAVPLFRSFLAERGYPYPTRPNPNPPIIYGQDKPVS